jgi:hypothetical protein
VERTASQQDPPGLADVGDALGGLVVGTTVVGVGREQRVAIAPLDHTLAGPLVEGREAEHTHGPADRVGHGRRREGTVPPPRQVGEEGRTDVARPCEPPPDRGEHVASCAGVEAPGGVDRTEHLLRRCALVGGELEAHRVGVVVAMQTVGARRQPDPIVLESVTQPGLRDAPPRLELVGQRDDVGHVVGIEIHGETGRDPAEEQAGEPG